MARNQQKKASNRDGPKFLLLSVLLLVLTFAFASLLIFGFLKCAKFFGVNDIKAEHYISLISGAIGGLCALAGVWITILCGRLDKNRESRQMNEPELFSPDRYDIADAKTIKLAAPGSDSIPFPNRLLYLKNTMKVSFVIIEVNIGGMKLIPYLVSYIEQGDLFRLSFSSPIGIEKMTMRVRSANRYDYLIEIELKRNCPYRIEVKQEC